MTFASVRSFFQLPKNRVNRRSVTAGRFLLRYLEPYRAKFILSLIALLLSSLAGLAFPGLTGLLIDAATKPSADGTDRLGQLTLILMATLVAQSFFSYIKTYYMSEVAERSVADIRRDLFAKILTLPMSFYHQNRVGELTSRINNDVGMIQHSMTVTVSELIRQMVILVGGIGLVAYTSLRLTSIVMVSLPVIVVLALFFGRAIRRAGKEVQDLYAEFSTIVEETFQGITVVKAFTSEQREAERLGLKLDQIISRSLFAARARGAFIAFVLFLLFGGIVGVIWFGGRMVQTGELTLGELTSFVLYAVFVGGAMGSFADLYATFQRALGASERVRDLFDTPSENLDGQVAERAIRGNVDFEAISFAYPSRPDTPVLADVSFCVPAGSSLAIVGPSGAGKSTISGLLMRFYEPTSGEIRVDGVAATAYDLREYRSGVGIVPQDIVLFGGTIAENIAYGAPDASPERIREAAGLANALEFIENFPDGLATIVGERGVQLSGGQRQRVAIARAIMKNPSILILDEATSSLDAESERLVQIALEKVMQHRTTFIIAHRLSTIRNADRVAVIRGGSIVEIGTYDELIAQAGTFARLVAMQNRAGEDLLDEEFM